MTIICDSREQRPLSFLNCSADITVKAGALACGDYSIEHFENRIAIERKSMSDLIGSISTGRDRFFRELDRARGLESFAIVVEGAWQDLLSGNYRSKMTPAAASATCAAIMARYHFPMLFAGTRDNAALFVASFFRQWLRGKAHELEAIQMAMKTAGQ